MAAAEGVSIQGREELRMLQRRLEQSSAPASLPRTNQEQTESGAGRVLGQSPFPLRAWILRSCSGLYPDMWGSSSQE